MRVVKYFLTYAKHWVCVLAFFLFKGVWLGIDHIFFICVYDMVKGIFNQLISEKSKD